MSLKRVDTCVHCDRTRESWFTRRLCSACYTALKTAGRLDEYPPVPTPERRPRPNHGVRPRHVCDDCGRVHRSQQSPLCRRCRMDHEMGTTGARMLTGGTWVTRRGIRVWKPREAA